MCPQLEFRQLVKRIRYFFVIFAFLAANFGRSFA